jgi:hypothetical protein
VQRICVVWEFDLTVGSITSLIARPPVCLMQETERSSVMSLRLRNAGKSVHCNMKSYELVVWRLSVLRWFSVDDRMINERGPAGGLRIGRGNQSTLRKPAPVPLYFHYECQMTWSGIVPGPPRWEAHQWRPRARLIRRHHLEMQHGSTW